MTPTTRAYIGLGSNLANPIEQARAGIAALQRLPQSRVAAGSALYRTAPVGVTMQPDFINAVCALHTALPPEALLRRLLAIECEHGRRRDGVRGGSRRLDLDLPLYGDLQSDAAEVTLPHPRLHERAFVLYPLCEIAPTLRVPGRGPVTALLAGCAGQAVERLAESTVSESRT